MSNEHVAMADSHTHLDTIRTYLTGCNTSDVSLMKSTFAPDVSHYFMTGKSVHGAETLANHWREFNGGHRISTWTLDHGIEVGDEAVIEFTQIDAFDDGRPPRMLRGAEWYKFRVGKIIEIRAYFHLTSGKPVSELADFPYAERGYPTLGAQ